MSLRSCLFSQFALLCLSAMVFAGAEATAAVRPHTAAAAEYCSVDDSAVDGDVIQPHAIATGEAVERTYYAALEPDLEVSGNSVDLGTITGTASDTSIYVYNAGDVCFYWSAGQIVDCWLTVTPASGSDDWTCDDHDYMEIQVDPSCLGDDEGLHSGTFRVVRKGTVTDNETVTVSFNYQLTPDLEVNKNSVDLGVISLPTEDTSVYVYNAAAGSFDWTVAESVSWLTVDPMSGSTSTENDSLTITVDPTGLTLDQTYSDSFTVSRDGEPGDSETVTVSFDYQLVPNLEVNENSLDLGPISQVTADDSIYVYNVGVGSFDWTVTESVSWLTVDPMSGTTDTENDSLTVTVDPSGLTFGQLYSDSFTVTRNGAPGDSETVTVSFSLEAATQIPVTGTPPSGEVSGSIDVAMEGDWYCFDVPSGEGGTWSLWTAVGVDTILALYAAYDVPPPLAGNDNCEVPGCNLDHTALHSRIDAELTADTRYYLKVRAAGTNTGAYTLKVQKYVVPDNFDPVLTNGGVDPESGDLSSTFTYTVDYYDGDADPPDTAYVYVDGAEHTMTLASGSADDGTYEYQTTGADLGAGNHVHYFSFTDGQGGSGRLPAVGGYSAPMVDFEDMSESWAHDEILACVDAGIVGGYLDDRYHPEFPVDRAQMSVFISRSICDPMGEEGMASYTPPVTPTFWDVPASPAHWAYKYVEYVNENGVAGGYLDGGYHPEFIVDRGQMAVFIARAMVGGDEFVPDHVGDPTFPDVPATHWTYKYVEYIAGEGVAGGFLDGLYHPEPEYIVTRDQMAVYICRAFDLLP